MRRALFILALLIAAPLRAALVVPEAGLPQGRVSGPVMGFAFQPIASDRWTQLKVVVEAGALRNPALAPWTTLSDDHARLAAAPLGMALDDRFWRDAAAFEALPAARRAELLARLEFARSRAALVVSNRSTRALSELQDQIARGRVGEEDLAAFAATLEALSIHGEKTRAVALEVRSALALSKARREAAAFAPKPAEPAVAGPESSKDQARLARYDKVGRAARWASYGLFGAAAAGSLIHPQFLHLAQAAPALGWSAVAFSAVSRFFEKPRALPHEHAAAPRLAPDGKKRSSLGDLKEMLHHAQENLSDHLTFQAEVGAADVKRFRDWAVSGLRTALSWFPISMISMLAASVVGAVAERFIHLGVDAPGPIPVDVVLGHSLLEFVNALVASSIAQQAVFLLVGYNALAWLAKKTGLTGRAARWAAIAASLALFAPFAVWGGYAPASLFVLGGIELVILYVYARSGSLAAAVGLQAFVSATSMESARMVAFLADAAKGALAGAASWTSLALAGMLGAALLLSAGKDLFKAPWVALKAAIKRQTDRLAAVGKWWQTHRQGERPKGFWPMLSTGLLWALPLLAGMDLVETLVHRVYPQAAPTPEILSRMLLMPLDVIAFNFIIVAALEEWVFRRGVFDWIRNRLNRFRQGRWFWPAAIASALIFSAAHYVDFGAVLAHFGIGSGTGDLGSALAGAYTFTWSSFIARAVGGLILAALYAGSGSIMIPVVAHFGSNLLEGLGMRWGTGPFLMMAALILVMQLRPGRTDEKR